MLGSPISSYDRLSGTVSDGKSIARRSVAPLSLSFSPVLQGKGGGVFLGEIETNVHLRRDGFKADVHEACIKSCEFCSRREQCAKQPRFSPKRLRSHHRTPACVFNTLNDVRVTSRRVIEFFVRAQAVNRKLMQPIRFFFPIPAWTRLVETLSLRKTLDAFNFLVL